MDGFPEEEIFHYGRVTIQIAPDLLPAIPVRMGEVAAFAQILTHTEILAKIQQQGRFARARFGSYDLLDFVVVLTGSILSGEPTLLAFYERLAPCASRLRCCLVAIGCLIARRFLVFLPLSIGRRWKP